MGELSPQISNKLMGYSQFVVQKHHVRGQGFRNMDTS